MEKKYTILQIKKREREREKKLEKDPVYVVPFLEMFVLVVGVLTAQPKERPQTRRSKSRTVTGSLTSSLSSPSPPGN